MVTKRRLEEDTAANNGCAESIEHAVEHDLDNETTVAKQRKRSRLLVPCHDMVQFAHKDFYGILKIYIEERDDVSNPEIVFKTSQDDDGPKIDGSKMFVSICEAGGETGQGRGVSKRKSKCMACLDIIQNLGLVPEELLVDTMAVAESRNPKRVKPLMENGNYISGDFKEALRQHLRRSDPEDELIFETSEQVFITTCRTKKGDFQGLGKATTKKKSVHLASLDVMFKMGLLTKEQHLEKHPNTTATVNEGLDKLSASETAKVKNEAGVHELEK